MKTIFVLVDALKSLYLTEDNMPFLFSLSKQAYYVEQIIPCAGFCERSELFSGLDGYDTGNFTAIGYLPDNSPYSSDSFFLSLVHYLDLFNSRIARKIFSIWRKRSKKSLSPYKIPYQSLKYFALTEDGDSQLIPHREIFDELKDKRLSYTLDGFTTLSSLGERCKLTPVDFVKRETEKKTDFIPVYIGIIDVVGHRYGKDIDNIRPYLKGVDNQIREIFLLASCSNYAICVLGDHGMVPINTKVDVIKTISSLGLKLHKDYEAFYDSTLARYWFYNEHAAQCIRASLESNFSKYGFIVDKTNCERYRIPLGLKEKNGKPVYGDLIWCANPGVLISPDYFHSAKESENGMHGYIKVVEGHGTGLYVESYEGILPNKEKRADSSSICGRLCKLLGINNPN